MFQTKSKKNVRNTRRSGRLSLVSDDDAVASTSKSLELSDKKNRADKKKETKAVSKRLEEKSYGICHTTTSDSVQATEEVPQRPDNLTEASQHPVLGGALEQDQTMGKKKGSKLSMSQLESSSDFANFDDYFIKETQTSSATTRHTGDDIRNEVESSKPNPLRNLKDFYSFDSSPDDFQG